MSDEEPTRASEQADTEASTTEDVLDDVNVEALAANPEVDSDIASYDDRRDTNDALQQSVHATVAAGLGTDKDAIIDRLNEELRKRDLPEQPWRWVEAVAEEAQVGREYRVSGTE